jgi:hypothetical protein
VLTEHKSTKATPGERESIRRCAFETRDFYLACFLRCAGYELLGLRAEGSRKVFVFKDLPTRRADVIAFYSKAGSVRPLTFAAAIKDMKALLHNA